MKFKRFLSGMMVAAMVAASLPVSGLAGRVDAAEGDTVIEAVSLATDGRSGDFASTVTGETSREWKFEDGAENTLTDSSGASLSADSASLTVAEVAGKQAFSGKVQVSGSQQSDKFNITGTSTPIVLSFSMYANEVPNASLASQTVIGKVRQYVVQMNASQLIFNTYTGSQFKQAAYAIDADTFYDTWHDIVAVYTGGDANTLLLYVDGTLAGSTAAGDSGLVTQADTFTLGYNGLNTGNPDYPGYLADVAMYTGGEAISATATVDEITATLDTRNKVLDIEAQAQKTVGYSVTGTTWYSGMGTEGETLSGSGTFDSATDYTLQTVLKASDGYVFDAATAVTLSCGDETLEPESATVANDGSTLTLTYYFLTELSQAKLELKAALEEAKAIIDAGNNAYSAVYWNAFTAAYAAASTAAENADATLAEITSAMETLTAKQAALANVKMTTEIYLPASSLDADADSINANNPISNAVDGDSSTSWQTKWREGDEPQPTVENGQMVANNNLYILLDGTYTVSGVRYQPNPGIESNAIKNGAILSCNIYVATEKVASEGDADAGEGGETETGDQGAQAAADEGDESGGTDEGDESGGTGEGEGSGTGEGEGSGTGEGEGSGTGEGEGSETESGDSADDWDWQLVVAGQTWDSYPGTSTAYTNLRRYASFEAVEGVQAVRIEALTTGGSKTNATINAAEVDILALCNLTDQDAEGVFELYDAIMEDDIQTTLAAGNDNNTWTDASWSSFVSAYDDAMETFRDLYDTTAADGTVFTAAITSLRSAYEALQVPCLCTITLNSMGVDGVTGDVLALGDLESAEYTLTTDYSVASNGCLREGHTDNTEATVTYQVTGTGATLSDGTKLTVTNTATSVTVRVTITYNDADSVTSSTRYTVTSNRVKNLLTDAIAEAEKLEQGTKTDAAWQTLQDAIAAAKAVLENASATDTERSRAITALETAINTFNNSSDADTSGGAQTDDETAKSELYAKLNALINTANTKIAEQNASKTYTTESINALQTALNSAVNTYNKAVVGGLLYLENVTIDELTSAYDALDKAISGLVKASDGATTTPAPATTTTPQVGDEVSSGIYVYKVTGADTVEVVKLSDSGKNQTKLKIFNTVKLGGVTFKVTSIAKNAFKGNKKIKSAVIGKNVTTIGAKAFNGCTKLKKVTVKSKVLKTVGKAAFKKTSAKLTVKVPKAKKTAYKKLLKKGGVKASKVK